MLVSIIIPVVLAIITYYSLQKVSLLSHATLFINTPIEEVFKYIESYEKIGLNNYLM